MVGPWYCLIALTTNLSRHTSSETQVRDCELRALFSLCRRKAGKREKRKRAGSDGKGKERTEGRPTPFSPPIVHCPLTIS